MEDSLMHNFTTTLKKLRKLNSQTQQDLANSIESKRSVVANYERGARFPSIEKLIEIANHFQVSLDYLVLGKTSTKGLEVQGETLLLHELMAENTTILEQQLIMEEKFQEQQEEIKQLDEYIKAQNQYVQVLEKRQSNGRK